MFTKFTDFNKFIREELNYDEFSGIIGIKTDGEIMNYHLKYDEEELPFRIYLITHDGVYEELSILIPDTDMLTWKEFFLNPSVNKNIVDALEKENFIVKTNKTSIAGDKKTSSYKLII